MRLTHPSFRLRLAPMIDAFQQGLMRTFVDLARKHELLRSLKFHPEQLPVALRWSMHPEFGFPRSPFSVYRRFADYSTMPKIPLIAGIQNVVGIKALDFSEEMYLLSVSISLTSSQKMTITPLGKGGLEIEDKSFTMETSGTIILKTASIHGILFKGYGQVNSLIGIPQLPVLNAGNWDKIQLVGLPFGTGEIKNLGYQGDPQGFSPHALTTAKEASLLRLMMGNHFFTSPPSLTTLDPSVPPVPWKFPKPDQYLNFLGNGPDSQLSSIRSCLEKSDDFSWNRNRRQPAYIQKSTVSGISQPGTLGSTTTANATIPVVAQTLLSVSTENPASLALGFGTYDFLDLKNIRNQSANTNMTMAMAAINQITRPTGYLDLSMDYMVGANYTIRPFGDLEIPFFDKISKETEFCALGEEMPVLASVEQLEALGLQVNRPESIDLGYTESVKLRWKKPQNSCNYAIASSFTNATSSAKNEIMPVDKDCYFSILAPVPKNHERDTDPADRNKPIQTFPDEPLPNTGVSLHKYFIIPWDVFGRWGTWKRILHQAKSVKPQQPLIMSARLVLPNGEETTGLSPLNPTVNCRLEIEFSWDWIDRSPSKIQFAGTFFPADQTQPPASIPDGLARTATDSTSSHVLISFTNSGINQTPSSSHGEVSLMESSIPVDDSGNPTVGSQDSPSANLRKYKLVIDDLQCTFTGASPFEVAYAVYVQGLEKVRASANDWSDWSPGTLSKLPDPRPPLKTSLPAEIQFTSFPDSARVARGTLTWPAAAGALFYHVWEANEIAVRTTLEKVLLDQFPSDPSRHLLPLTASLVERATQLRDLLNQESYQLLCQKSFSRLSKNPLNERKIELEIPGGSDVLFLYSISSVNSANIESGKSNVVFFAVPKVSKPAAPMLKLLKHPLKNQSGPVLDGIEIQAFTTQGDEPIGYQLYRIRKIPSSNDVGQKGLPLFLEDNASWEPTNMTMPDGTVFNGKRILELTLTRSWKPLVYQAVAVGIEDPSNGIFSGESDPSNSLITWYPPTIPPQIMELAKTANILSECYLMETSAPLSPISLGMTQIELYRLGSEGTRTKLHGWKAGEIPFSPLPLTLATNDSEAENLPRINHQKMNTSTGITQLSLLVNAGLGTLLLKITDPLNRATEIELSN